MDLTISVAALSEQEQEAFDRAFQAFIGSKIVTILQEDDEYIFKNYDDVSDEFAESLGQFLKTQDSRVTVDKCRTMGFGEDGPRYSHENGHFVENYV